MTIRLHSPRGALLHCQEWEKSPGQFKANTRKASAAIHQAGISPPWPHQGYTEQHKILHKHCSSLISVTFHLQVLWAWLCYLYISRAIPKSPILATLPGPRQVRRQFLAAISLKGKGSKETEREEPLNHLTVLQIKKKTKNNTYFSELQRTQNSQRSQCLWITTTPPIPVYPHSRNSFVV